MALRLRPVGPSRFHACLMGNPIFRAFITTLLRLRAAEEARLEGAEVLGAVTLGRR